MSNPHAFVLQLGQQVDLVLLDHLEPRQLHGLVHKTVINKEF